MSRTVAYLPAFPVVTVWRAIPRRYLAALALVSVGSLVVEVLSGHLVGAVLSGGVTLLCIGTLSSSDADADDGDRT